MKNIIDAVLAVLTLLIPRLKKDTSKLGIKEGQEALVALNEVGLFLIQHFKDGVQSQDFSELYTAMIGDHAFKSKILSAYENYKLIPDEIEDIDVGEGLELVKTQVEYLPKYLVAFQKA